MKRGGTPLATTVMEIWTSILATAIHAPSPHNVQPWRVKIIDERQALLYIDNSRTLPKEDLTGSFIILTMGLFLEALTLLAANRGHKLTWNLEHAAEWFADAIVKHPGDHLLSFARLTTLCAEPPRESQDRHRRDPHQEHTEFHDEARHHERTVGFDSPPFMRSNK